MRKQFFDMPFGTLLLARSISTVLLLAPCFPADAQQLEKVHRIGLLISATNVIAPFTDAFRHGMRDLGYVEGKNIILEIRRGEANPDHLSTLATELLARADRVIK